MYTFSHNSHETCVGDSLDGSPGKRSRAALCRRFDRGRGVTGGGVASRRNPPSKAAERGGSCRAAAEREREREGRAEEWSHTAEGRHRVAMGNAQDKPPGARAAGAAARPNRSAENRRDGSPEVAAAANGSGQSGGGGPAVDTSYLDAPAGALPRHLGRLKNEGNHLFKHGQFADAVEKYTQAIDGCAEAGEALGEMNWRVPRVMWQLDFMESSWQPFRQNGVVLIWTVTTVIDFSADLCHNENSSERHFCCHTTGCKKTDRPFSRSKLHDVHSLHRVNTLCLFVLRPCGQDQMSSCPFKTPCQPWLPSGWRGRFPLGSTDERVQWVNRVANVGNAKRQPSRWKSADNSFIDCALWMTFTWPRGVTVRCWLRGGETTGWVCSMGIIPALGPEEDTSRPPLPPPWSNLMCLDAGLDSPEDLCILYSNRAACYLKDGSSTDCIQDCTQYVVRPDWVAWHDKISGSSSAFDILESLIGGVEVATTGLDS